MRSTSKPAPTQQWTIRIPIQHIQQVVLQAMTDDTIFHRFALSCMSKECHCPMTKTNSGSWCWDPLQ